MAVEQQSWDVSHTDASGLDSPIVSIIDSASRLLLGLVLELSVVSWPNDGDISFVSMLATSDLSDGNVVCIGRESIKLYLGPLS